VTQSQSVCVEEHSTRHYRGRWRGFGPVRDREHVLYAVFAATSRNDGRLTAGSFTKNLNDCTESLARRQYVTIRIFDDYIARNSRVDGISRACVADIRHLRADIITPAGTLNVKAMCVVDLVEPGDCDGHATMGFSEAISGISQTQLGKKRQAIKMDLARSFSRIESIEQYDWPSALGIVPKRLASICRAFALLFYSRLT
jgi:hypothetical protein